MLVAMMQTNLPAPVQALSNLAFSEWDDDGGGSGGCGSDA